MLAQSFKIRQIVKQCLTNVSTCWLYESCWQGRGTTSMQSYTILHSDSDSSHSGGVTIVLTSHARVAWEAAGSVFKPINKRIKYIHLKSHLSYITVFAVYTPTNLVTSTIEANQPSDDFYNDLHSAMATIPATNMVTIYKILMLE